MAIVDIDLIPIGSGKPKPQNLVIYDNGQENIQFVAKAVSVKGWEFAPTVTAPTIYRNTDSIRLYLPDNPNNYRCGTVFIDEMIDFSLYSKLHIEYVNNGNLIYTYYAKGQGAHFEAFGGITEIAKGSSGEKVVDLTDKDFSSYIAFGLMLYSYDVCNLNISKIWLEP